MNDRELADALPDEPRTPGPYVTAIVGPGSVDSTLDALLLYCESHRDDELGVQRGGTTLGYLDAETLYRLVLPLTREVGGADHFELYGEPRDQVLVLDCPLGDFSLRVVLYPVDSPPRCPHHPDRELRVRS
jgi:hypothetical protein